MPNVNVKLTSSFDPLGFNQLNTSINRLGTDLKKKLALPDISKSVLGGLGLGSGFAVAQKAAEQITGFWQRAAESAQKIASYSDRQLAATERLLRRRRTDEQEISKLADDRAAKERAVAALKDPSKRQFEHVTYTGTGRVQSRQTLTADFTKEQKEDIAKLDAEIRELDDEISAAEKAIFPKGGSSKIPNVLDRFKADGEAIENSVKTYLTTVLKPALDAEHKLLDARQKQAVEQKKLAAATSERDFARQTAALEAERLQVQNNNLLTEQEKRARILPLLERENELIDERIALLVEAAAREGDPAAAAALQDRIDRLEREKAENGGQITGIRTPDTLANRDQKGMRDMSDPSQHYQTAGDGAMGGITQWLTQVGTLGDQVANGLANAFNSAANGISNSIVGLISQTMTWSQALTNIGVSVIQGIIQSFANMAAQWIVRQIVMAVAGNALRAASLAATAPVALATAALWAPAATAASIATFGAAAVEGAVMAQAAIWGSMLAFEKGGVVPGGEQFIRVNESGTESVLNARATSMLGRGGIDALNAGQMIPDVAGSITRPGFAPPVGGGGGGGAPNFSGNRRPERVFYLAKDMNDIRAIQRANSDFDDVIVDVVGRNKGRIIG
jgi:hypothetical protein